MRTSVISRFAKNDRALSGRRRVAVLAATTVLAGGVQFLATDTAWACGDHRLGGAYEAPADVPGLSPDTAITSARSSVVADGSWNEVSLKITNKAAEDAHGMEPFLGLVAPAPGTAVRLQDVRIQYLDYTGAWKNLRLQDGCTRAVEVTGSQRQRMAANSSLTFKFRYSLASGTPAGVTAINLFASTEMAGSQGAGSSAFKPVKVTHPQDTAAAKPTTPAKPKPTPTKAAPAKAAEPATEKTEQTGKTEQTKGAAPAAEAPKAPAAAPATTAPAGTPELAQTGSSSADTFLAAGSALFLALGAGVLIAVRRLRPQR
ncbi:LAETG motif-containing sortase-dependent surface protein [Kitasatospora sp. NPDC058444]|uniref:LAETG motif-containing sortase-dependent surface protein n=1 Tax=Kitasatospora sp. NPDC058444 TaxID=3346504 RepID=UPI003652EAD5